jgi:hypothetical protein
VCGVPRTLAPWSGAYFFLPQMWRVRPSPGGVFQDPTRLLPSLKVRPVSVRLLILSEMLLKMPISSSLEFGSCDPYPPSLNPNRSLVDGPPKSLAAAPSAPALGCRKLELAPRPPLPSPLWGYGGYRLPGLVG